MRGLTTNIKHHLCTIHLLQEIRNDQTSKTEHILTLQKKKMAGGDRGVVWVAYCRRRVW